MNGIYISNMEMPTSVPVDITIWPEGHYKNSWGEEGNVIPTINIQPIKIGKWINNIKESKHSDWYICSVCQGWYGYKHNYCPNCGALMENRE